MFAADRFNLATLTFPVEMNSVMDAMASSGLGVAHRFSTV
jgi:hypothetical protein